MSVFDAIILGIIEGLTEFLPISSTGHLILASNLLGIAHSEFLKSFGIIIQLGAILAVVCVYFKKLCNFTTIKLLIVSVIPTGIIGVVAYPIIKSTLLESTMTVIWMLFLGGIVIILFEKYLVIEADNEDEFESISYRQAVLIGLFQSIALIPGVSRSAATIIGGLYLGLTRRTIVEYSFMLAVPTMLAASVFDIYKNHSALIATDLTPLIVGFVVSFITAMLAIKYFLRFIKTNDFQPFGIYRILVAVLFFFWLRI
jgi:undecaprenyl-diphosphatase